MKKSIVLLLAAASSTSAFAVENLHCYQSDSANQYEISFDAQSNTATVTSEGRALGFGELSCSDEREGYGVVAQCHSRHVFDAGFSVNLNRYQQEGIGIFFRADLYSITIAGSKLVASLPCWPK